MGASSSLVTTATLCLLTGLQLVRTGGAERDLDVIPTFAAGTMLVTNRVQRGRNDMSQVYLEPETASSAESEPEPENLSGDPNSPTEVPPTVSPPPQPISRSRSAPTSFGRTDPWPSPLAVLNLYDLAYVGDKYGVWGKKQYAADWWKSLNWESVVRRNSNNNRQ